jgi:hypothetical protein
MELTKPYVVPCVLGQQKKLMRSPSLASLALNIMHRIDIMVKIAQKT